MDNFVEELRQERSWLSTEEETEDVSTANALLSGIYLPLLPRYFHHPRNSGVKPSEFQKVKEDCLCCIQDALLQSQWQRAAELMISYLEMLENTTAEKRVAAQEEIWRIGTEILQQHPQSNIEESNYFADRMKNLGVKRYLKISLEHAFHLLCSGFLDEAYQNLILAESWRYGEETVAQEKELKLVQAYKGLLDYYTWLKKKTDLLMLDEDSYTRSSLQQEMHGLYQQAKGSLKEIIRIPGVWDPFVICYVDILHELVPSHELMLEFYNLLKKSKKRKKHKLQLKVIFAALDFAGWKENIKAWSYLAKQTVEILQNSDKQFHWLKKEWDTRKDWWPAFHFSPYLAKNNWQENKKLACEKVLIAGILLGKDCKYFKYVTKEGCKVQKKKFRQLKKFVKEHSWVSLRLADT
ncbi:TATA box-binding protein-associated factor RNA polymerase I subunit A isoform X2 [Python bivittatus]|uniref:TATA box-binding protein-associated factor RNA polymerase I subunit A isoform X2 n=1 Tax=Python bivittatus TaxID=176946 RepID=A0A9F5IYE0_PYTBI|nr:TATA box-binding protein-associated factor RNA polymerase I subunit A isoform X2 [Python bivittatus]